MNQAQASEKTIVGGVICKAIELGYTNARVSIEGEPADYDAPDSDITKLEGIEKAVNEALSGDVATILFESDSMGSTAICLVLGQGNDIVNDGWGKHDGTIFEHVRGMLGFV